LAVLLTIWLAALVMVTACWFLDRPPILRQWVLTDLRPWLLEQWRGIGPIGFGLSALAAFYAMLLIHELGHVIVGLVLGFRLRSLRIGPLLLHVPFRVAFYRGPGAMVNGVAELIPVVTDNLAGRVVVMVLGGPLANILSAIAVLFLPLPITVFSELFIAFSIVNGVNDLFPFESRLGVSDGTRIGMFLVQPQRAERWLALLQLAGQLRDGVLPESLSADCIAKAIAIRDDSVDTVTAHAFGYFAAFHQHDDAEAAQRLETCLEFSSRATPALREALMSDAAVFQARRRKRADLAEQWLAAISAKTKSAWFRSRAEAAILEAKGDVAGAMKKLMQVEAAIGTLPENGQRETLLRLLERWKSELLRC
jgi:hypothetical protein